MNLHSVWLDSESKFYVFCEYLDWNMNTSAQELTRLYSARESYRYIHTLAVI